MIREKCKITWVFLLVLHCKIVIKNMTVLITALLEYLGAGDKVLFKESEDVLFASSLLQYLYCLYCILNSSQQVIEKKYLSTVVS